MNPSRVVAVDVAEIDVKMIGRHPVARSLRPLDNHQCPLAQKVIPADVRELRLIVETIEVHVGNRRLLRLVLVHESVRRARHRLGNSVSIADGLCQSRLACAQLATQRDNERSRRRFAKLLPPLNHLLLGEIEMTFRCERGNDVTVRLHYRSTLIAASELRARDLLPSAFALISKSSSRRRAAASKSRFAAASFISFSSCAMSFVGSLLYDAAASATRLFCSSWRASLASRASATRVMKRTCSVLLRTVVGVMP